MTDARIDELEAKLTQLGEELERLRAERIHTMRRTYRCWACGGKRVLHFTSVSDETYDDPTQLMLHRKPDGFFTSGAAVGPLEAFACPSCRLVEWHAASLENVKPDGVTIVERHAEDAPAPGTTPYR